MSNQIYNVGGQIVTPDIYFQIGMGMIPGMEDQSASGFNPALRADWETVWHTGGLYPWPNAAAVISVVSDSADDDVVGIGARHVEIRGVDSNWDLLIETVALSGVTPVETIGQFLRINRVIVSVAGTEETNRGTVTISHAVAGILQTIQPLYGLSRAAIVSVPNGFSLGIIGMSATMHGTATVAELLIHVDTFAGVDYVLLQGLLFNNVYLDVPIKIPRLLPERTDIELITVSDLSNKDSTVMATLNGFSIDKNYS